MCGRQARPRKLGIWSDKHVVFRQRRVQIAGEVRAVERRFVYHAPKKLSRYDSLLLLFCTVWVFKSGGGDIRVGSGLSVFV